jgi:hydroxypyruvate isomerase
MPKFSANLGFLWPDRPLLDRIDAAANAGFKAIELHWPYATPTMAAISCCRRVSPLPRLLSHLASD